MTFNYTNFRGDVYHLYEKKTKKGNPSYYFATSSEGKLVDDFPSGYEIYEEPNGKVYIRKEQVKRFTDEEIDIIQDGMNKHSQITDYKLDVKGDFIYIYTVIPMMENPSSPLLKTLDKSMLEPVKKYETHMGFELMDTNKRLFSVHRFCFLGGIDDWMELDYSLDLSKLVSEYVIHLGQDSFFDLE